MNLRYFMLVYFGLGAYFHSFAKGYEVNSRLRTYYLEFTNIIKKYIGLHPYIPKLKTKIMKIFHKKIII